MKLAVSEMCNMYELQDGSAYVNSKCTGNTWELGSLVSPWGLILLLDYKTLLFSIAMAWLVAFLRIRQMSDLDLELFPHS